MNEEEEKEGETEEGGREHWRGGTVYLQARVACEASIGTLLWREKYAVG